MAKVKKSTKKPIEQYDHKGKKRVNNPPVGLVTPETDKDSGKKTYKYDPHIDPSLQWAGKAEHTSFEVPTVSLHVHERIDTRTIIDATRKRNGNGQQLSLFQTKEENPPLREAIEFYRHKHNWSNRLIAGDSLLVMNSLIEKEGLAGQVQMIYIDPPYGIRYGSNFQPFVNKRDVKDGWDEDLTQEPEMIKAFRDTWELGIHSYLTYLRDRLLLARELLTESGSIFVQISDENVHLVRCLMDEVFGVGNFVSLITFRTKIPLNAAFLPNIADSLVWYARDKLKMKFHRLFIPRAIGGDSQFTHVEFPNGSYRKMTQEELDNPRLLPNGAKPYRLTDLLASGHTDSCHFEFELDGKKYYPPGVNSWKTTPEGMKMLIRRKRVRAQGKTPSYVFYADDYPVMQITNQWVDTQGAIGKSFAVQTATKVVERCLLMTTDPGDLVFDPTCVREGTRILTPLNPPVNGGTSGVKNANGGTFGVGGVNGGTSGVGDDRGEKSGVGGDNGGTSDVGGVSRGKSGVGDDNGETSHPVTAPKTPSPLTGRVGEGPLTGCIQTRLIAVESLRPGDSVIGHDGKPHRILRTICKTYQGTMVGIQHKASAQILWVTADHRILCRKRIRSYNADRTWQHVPRNHFELARAMRKELTPAERKLWKLLRQRPLGVKFRRQHPIGSYVVDFYSWEKGLVVEVDGDSHFRSESLEYDSKRDAYLKSLGLKVLRFNNQEVTHQTEAVLEKIVEIAQQVESSEDHYKQWRRADSLQVGDVVYYGLGQKPIEITNLLYEEVQEEVYDMEVEDVHSFLTEVCAVHNCGSGTTAYVAEQWGRRWITCDTSRVAITLAKQRLMTALFDYYELAHPEEGVGSGFKYKTVPHITLGSIANNEPPAQETLYDQPFVDNSKARVTGPFTVEAVPAPVVRPLSPSPQGGEGWGEGETADESIARSGETLRQAEWRDELLKCGIRGKAGQHILFSRVEPLSGTRWLHAEAETRPNDLGADSVRETESPYGRPQRAVISFGPEHAPLEQRQVELAWEEARKLVPRPALLIFAAFQFDPEAAKDIDEIDPGKTGMSFLKVQMNADLLTDDLKKKRASNESFWLIGQPDVCLEKIKDGKDKGKYRVEVLGFDYYNTKTGAIESGGTDKIAMWMLDTDYDGRSLLPRQVFFPMSGEKDGWSRLAKNLKAEIDEELIEAYRGTVSLPFEPGGNRRIAVKIIDDRGIESLKFIEVE